MAKQINPVTLSFNDPYLEDEFLVQKLKYDVFLLGLISIFGLLSNGIYCIYEFSDPASAALQAKWLRLLYLIPLSVLTFLGTRFPFIRTSRTRITILSIVYFSSMAISILIFNEQNTDERNNFLTGIIIILFASALFSGLHFKWLSFFLICIVTVILYLSHWFTLSSGLQLDITIQILVTLLLALVASYLQELLHRENFISRKKVEISRKRLSEKAALIQEENLFKDTLLSIIAHDFRGPLARLQGTINLASRNYITPAETELYLKKLSAEFDTVNLMSERVLNWVKSQMKGTRIHAEQFDLCKLTELNFQLYHTQSAEKEIELVNLVPATFMVFSDFNIVNTVLRNLISNAIKFSTTGKINITATQEENAHTICCSNTGIGFDPAVLEKIGTAFQFTNGTKNEIGFGMGIKMCNDLLKYLNSRLSIQSSQDGLTMISFTLPFIVSEKQD